MNIYNCILILILVCVLCVYIWSGPHEAYNRRYYHFFTKEQTKNFFAQDKDNYIQDLTDLDIKAQRSKSKQDYQQKIILSADDFTQDEKKKLERAMQQADRALETIELTGFDGKKASKLPWIVALTRGKVYEDGLPHTRENVIFLSDKIFDSTEKQLARIMMHEKIHVYERLFPNDMQKWLKQNGYTRYKKWKTFKRARSNPDIDDWVYLSPDKKPMLVEYTSTTPNTIHEVRYPDGHDYTTEHPNEVLAYQLETYL